MLESESAAAPLNPFSPATCAFTFTTGAGDTFLKYCVTANGNITLFETPAGHEHIAVGIIGEGYGICDFGNHDSKPIEYFDYAESGDSGGWSAAAVVSQTAKSVKIARAYLYLRHSPEKDVHRFPGCLTVFFVSDKAVC